MARSKAGNSAGAGKGVRCAIYTRKSSEEGLEQEFNSLDAQREACEAYIRSQKHEGWTLLPAIYDDGGLSGATMERPALKRLLGDIKAGHIDTVVVYKVDRLTRSLSDFARLAETFDAQGVTFVSVTQQFNTTTSMGRLTLNMLLSFAQFEREVTGERIRDKIAASKKKGMWMGGLPPLGYDVQDKKLVVNEPEAATVRHIFRRYTELGAVRPLKEELDRAGIVTKVRTDRHDRRTGGKPFSRGVLYQTLQNRLYRGEVVNNGDSYPGQHTAIIDDTLWQAVQRLLARNRVERTTGAAAADPSLLAGLVYDGGGELMTPSHANKKGRRYRYYVSKGLITEGRSNRSNARRVPAGDLETLVENRLRQFLKDESALFAALQTHINPSHDWATLRDAAAGLAGRWPELSPSQKRAILLRILERIEINQESVEIILKPGQMLELLFHENGVTSGHDASAGQDGPGDGAKGNEHDKSAEGDEEINETTLRLTIPARLKRTGMETRLLIDGAPCRRRAPDHSLHRLLARAHQYRTMVMQHHGKTMAEMAAEAGVTRSYFSRVLRLAFLAPEIAQAILDDDHPFDLTAKHLAGHSQLPVAWEDQRKQLGCA